MAKTTPFKTPYFWYQDKQSWHSKLLCPFSLAYNVARIIDQKNKQSKQYKAQIPVICIGNATIGGGGKTPTAIAVMQLIKNNKLYANPCFLTRGYGAELDGPHIVNSKIHNFQQVGDEALLLAKHAPTIISKNRAAGAKWAKKNGYDIVVMDDGMQNPTLYKDIVIQVLPESSPFGNKKLFPAGPLREPLADAFDKTDIFININPKKILEELPSDKLLLTANIETIYDTDKKEKYIAFCGLARPEKFFNSCKNIGLNIIKEKTFPDHYPYTHDDLETLLSMATDCGASLITTEKDAVKIPNIKNIDKIEILPISLKLNDETKLIKLIQGIKKP